MVGTHHPLLSNFQFLRVPFLQVAASSLEFTFNKNKPLSKFVPLSVTVGLASQQRQGRTQDFSKGGRKLRNIFVITGSHTLVIRFCCKAKIARSKFDNQPSGRVYRSKYQHNYRVFSS